MERGYDKSNELLPDSLPDFIWNLSARCFFCVLRLEVPLPSLLQLFVLACVEGSWYILMQDGCLLFGGHAALKLAIALSRRLVVLPTHVTGLCSRVDARTQAIALQLRSVLAGVRRARRLPPNPQCLPRAESRLSRTASSLPLAWEQHEIRNTHHATRK